MIGSYHLVESLNKGLDSTTRILMCIARKKDNDWMDTNSDEIVFRRIFKDKKGFERGMRNMNAMMKAVANEEKEDITHRFYVTVNNRSSFKAWYNITKNKTDRVYEAVMHDTDIRESFENMDKQFVSELQSPSSKISSRFLVDVDAELLKFPKIIKDNAILMWPTPNGFHLVTEPFNYTKHEFEDYIELKKDGMLFLEQGKAYFEM